jgi:hypothetical protein
MSRQENDVDVKWKGSGKEDKVKWKEMWKRREHDGAVLNTL